MDDLKRLRTLLLAKEESALHSSQASADEYGAALEARLAFDREHPAIWRSELGIATDQGGEGNAGLPGGRKGRE